MYQHSINVAKMHIFV